MIATLARLTGTATLAALVSWPGTAIAGELAQPEGEVVLTVSGNISETNGDGVARFDMDMLTALDGRTIDTTTIWTDGDQQFTGVGLDTLLDHLGVEGGTLAATAINDYSVTIPVADATPDGPIIAYKLNGEAMGIRDKGPLWVIYPYDANPDFQSETIYARSIWQLDRIEVMAE
ncbi:molybdopterin-dependent oxidoreductase [Tropicimonas isoalkanivorans]|uniref:Oxidoreductase molybdopterin-binding domain-containing protein n=1 Tax=Tropicimonas isoalkanivorans TaxID=441112 RepID=A0A1I1GE00_9RHOB|nr:molybdopterin-dependent oxidoreductase [Tropicimonas isoalkanivorans]SFC09685.1 hypothetical protein SAMN04488094_102524 [Tropicimonas isoalkanivorans]